MVTYEFCWYNEYTKIKTIMVKISSFKIKIKIFGKNKNI